MVVSHPRWCWGINRIDTAVQRQEMKLEHAEDHKSYWICQGMGYFIHTDLNLQSLHDIESNDPAHLPQLGVTQHNPTAVKFTRNKKWWTNMKLWKIGTGTRPFMAWHGTRSNIQPMYTTWLAPNVRITMHFCWWIISLPSGSILS
jgi:hypothetical protein